jgi:hypothetical protein
MAKVFISYRRTDSAAFSGRIYERLIARFGRKNIFKDVDDIPPGVDFPEYIQNSLRQCAVVLVVIGPHWLEERDAKGERRLDDPGDFVRLEIETALNLRLAVVPLLVDGVKMPQSNELPGTLRPLTLFNTVQVGNDPDFARDIEQVITNLKHMLARRHFSDLLGRRRAVSPRAQVAPSRPQAPIASAALTPGLTPPVPVSESRTLLDSPLSAPIETAAVESQAGAQPFRSQTRFRRPLITVLAALLLIASFGALLSRGGGRVLRSNDAAAQTQTGLALADQATATAHEASTRALQTQIAATITSAAQTATAQVKSPYFTAIPGPCGDQVGIWENASQGPFKGHATFTCLSDGFEITIPAEQTNSSSYFVDLNAHKGYQVSIDVSNLVGDVCAAIWAERKHGTSQANDYVISGYSFSICHDGSYSIFSIGDGGAIQGRFLKVGSTSSSSAFSLKVVINGNSLQLTRNDQLLASATDETYSTWDGSGVALSINPRLGFTAGSGIFRNFSFAPL